MTELETCADSGTSKPTALAGLAVVVVYVVLVAVVCAVARRLDWTLGWTYVGLMVVTVGVNVVSLLCWNSEVIWRRMVLGKGTKTWDMVLMIAFFAPAMIAIFVVAVREAGVGAWGEPGAAWLLGLLIFVCGWSLVNWSMVVNPFFEKTVRIQSDHGHRVIDTGPYAYVRHPGYVGLMGWILSTPLLLTSAWAFVPAVLAAAGLVTRTVLEDRMLRAELAGYAEYSARVRFRLIPGIW